MLSGKVIVSGLVPVKATGMLRLAGDITGMSLYMGRTDVGASKISMANDMPYETTLMPVPNPSFEGFALGDFLSPTIIVPQWLPTVPDWAVTCAADSSIAGAIQSFGGATNALLVGTVREGTLDIPNILKNANFTNPRFLRGGALAFAAEAYTSAVANNEVLMLFPPATTKQAAEGTNLIQAFSGLVFQDAQSIATLWLLYQEANKPAMMLSSHGAPLGRIKLSSFDKSLNTIGITLPIIDSPPISEFDADRQDGVYFLLAATDDWPLPVLFDTKGDLAMLDWPLDGIGPGHWITSPTVLKVHAESPIKITQDQQTITPSFLFAFIEMTNKGAAGIRLGAVIISQNDGSPSNDQVQ